jgi:hypothetical protein
MASKITSLEDKITSLEEQIGSMKKKEKNERLTEVVS